MKRIKDSQSGRFVTTHGQTFTPEYAAWGNAIDRCSNPNAPQWPIYGARGITVCKRWRKSFEAFLADMGKRPPGTTLDRIDTDGHYEPGNCRWATPKEQALNRRNTRLITAFGVTRTVAEWAAVQGLTLHTLNHRLYRGWTVERALSTPKLNYRGRE